MDDVNRLLRQAKGLKDIGAMHYRVYENLKVEAGKLGLTPQKYEQVVQRIADVCLEGLHWTGGK